MTPAKGFPRHVFLAFTAVLVARCAVLSFENPAAPYPGISVRQHELAQDATHEFFSHHWDRAETLCCDMKRLENGNGLLPMSNMLRFAMRSWRILNDEFPDRVECLRAYKELEPLRSDCIHLLHTRHFPDSTLATRLFLEGGIDGFNATLKIRSHPFVAMVNGLKAVRLFEKAQKLAPQMNDVYLGLGLSQCALANEPGIIRAAMGLFNGLHVSLDSGLTYLRICSTNALYTNDGAREYLIQFLSPFKAGETAEKEAVFKTLEALYPNDPFYVFQEIDENLAFHREKAFSDWTIAWVRPLIDLFDTCNFSLKRYANLVRWQCSSIDTTLRAGLRPEAFQKKQSYSFYPLFLDAAHGWFTLGERKNPDAAAGREKSGISRAYRSARSRATSVLRASDINPMLREYYLWHIEDGLP
jgi:hypothetical protein